ncbi:MAG: hypothetical protein WB767_09095 [Nocardioides sp.]
MSPLARRHARLHVVATLGVALAFIVVALSLPTSGETRSLSMREQNELFKAAAGLPHVDPVGAPFHTHDARFNDALARGGESGKDAADPTTAAEARRAAAYVASERRLPDPKLTTAQISSPRLQKPENRYAMANGCYRVGSGAPFYFKATDLGTYLLYSKNRQYLATTGGLGLDREPSLGAEWKAVPVGKGLGLRSSSLYLTQQGSTFSLQGLPSAISLTRARGCTEFPESQIDIAGNPHAGVSPFQEVRGFVDAHTHGMAFEFLGGSIHCGRPWHKYGITKALVDCADHTLTGGNGALLETFLSGEPTHDPVGWPTFKDWPAPESLTHEGTYYKWMERAWRGGQRLFVNLLVENNKLCEIYPLKRNSCDDMDSIRLQARQMFNFQDYIDAQFGGPGKGFYRIVRTPFEARRVINAGKMAVIMGIETSVPFGCTFKQVLTTDVAACTKQDITRQIGQMHKMGVRQMELVNKFDNALGGVAGDGGETGLIINGANFLETGTFWDMKACDPEDGVSADNPQITFPEISAEQQDALFGAIGSLFGPALPAIPIYAPPAHCNDRGLTSLGEHTIREMVKRNMIYDPDHLSVKARNTSLDLTEKLNYPGVLSSHSWSTPDAYPRFYEQGGFITPYAGSSTSFVEKWRTHVGWADQRYYWGIGFGADINGLGAQGAARGANVANKVNYPFTGIGGITIDRQRTGQRVFDINKDGVAQYGMYPDWVEDLTKVASATSVKDGPAIFDDMSRGAEAYLQMWERAEGIAADSCRNPGLRQQVATVTKQIRRGMTTEQVMRRVGQPFERLGNTFGVCAKAPGKPRVMMRIEFSPKGRVTGIDV